MSRFLIISDRGRGLGLGLRLKDEGHDVITHLRSKAVGAPYDNLLKKTDRFDRELSPGTTVVFDSAGGGKTADRLRGQGWPVFGGGMFADQIVDDTELAQGLLEESGIGIEIRAGITPDLALITGGWFDGANFARPMYHAVDRRRLMNEELGPICE